MSKLNKIINASKEVEIRAEKLKLFPLTIEGALILERLNVLRKDKDLPEVRKEIVNLSRELIRICYREEEFTEEEFKNMSMDLFSELYCNIIENIEKTPQSDGIKRIRELKEQTVQQQSE